MDIRLETTPADAAGAISDTASADAPAATAADDARLLALRAAGGALVAAAGLEDTDTVELSLAMSDEPGWAVVRVGKIVKGP